MNESKLSVFDQLDHQLLLALLLDKPELVYSDHDNALLTVETAVEESVKNNGFLPSINLPLYREIGQEIGHSPEQIENITKVFSVINDYYESVTTQQLQTLLDKLSEQFKHKFN